MSSSFVDSPSKKPKGSARPRLMVRTTDGNRFSAVPGAPVPNVIGHRGAAGHAPENTLPSLRAAHHLAAAWIEFDVKLSRDGVPVLFHDDTLERTTDGRGRIADRFQLLAGGPAIVRRRRTATEPRPVGVCGAEGLAAADGDGPRGCSALSVATAARTPGQGNRGRRNRPAMLHRQSAEARPAVVRLGRPRRHLGLSGPDIASHRQAA